MMQASGSQATLLGLVSRVLSGEAGLSAPLESADGAGFVESMATQIKTLMLQRGEDPTEVAALDDADLVSRFFALMQSQSASVEGGESLGAVLGDALLEGEEGVDETAPEVSADPALVQAPQASASGAQTSVPAGSLPTFILQQLAESSQMGGVRLADSAATASREWLQSLGLGTALGETVMNPMDVDGAALTATQGAFSTTLASQGLQAMPAEGVGLSTTPSSQGLASSSFDEAGMLESLAQGAGLDSAQSSSETALSDALEFSLTESLGTGAEGDRRALEDSAGLATTGVARMAGSSADVATVARTTSALDLSKLLQPGGEGPLADQVKWSLREGIETAEMKLHPPSLGALDVRVSMDGDKAHVQFVSAHPIVREVLEAALPRLREALALDGLSLGNVSVSDQPARERGETGQEQPGRMTAWNADSEEGEGGEEVARVDSTLSALSRRLDVFT